MSHAVDQSRMVKGFLVQEFFQVGSHFFFIFPVFQNGHHLIKHLYDFDIGAAVAGTLQRADRRRDHGIGVCQGRGYHMGGEGGVVTAAVLHVKDQSNVQNLRFQLCVAAVGTQDM